MKNIKCLIWGLILSFFSLPLLSQQVLINTTNKIDTSYTLYIDGAGDTSLSPTIKETNNDFVIKNDGNQILIGVGTATPTSRLHIKTGNNALQLLDGGQRDKYVLYSDFSGVGSWQSYGTSQARQADIGSSTSFTYQTGGYRYTGISITLESGVWMLDTQILVFHDTTDGLSSTTMNDRLFLAFCLGESPSSFTTITNDYLPGTSKYISNNVYKLGAAYTMIPGLFVVQNSSKKSKTYYLWVNLVDISGTIPENTKFIVGGQGTETICTAIYLGKTYQN